jgi:hypothetical protein
MADKIETRAQPYKTAAVAPAGQQAAQLRYVDRPTVAETFADSLTGLVYDGQTLRIEFAVTTLDEMQPNAPVTGRRSPSCRLVLTPNAAIELINRMQQVAAALTQAGVLKAQTPPPKA